MASEKPNKSGSRPRRKPRSPHRKRQPKRVLSVREIAGQILHKCLNHGQPARELLNKQISKGAKLARRDAAFLTELVYGTLRTASIADQLLSKMSRRKLSKISSKVLSQLRLAIYQYFFLLTPSHAAVNEAVSLFEDKRDRGFVNGLLRNLIRSVEGLKSGSELDDVPLSRLLPLNPEQSWVFSQDFFANEPTAWLAQAHGLPIEHVEQLIQQFGCEQARAICLAHNQTPELHLRVNSKRTSVDDVLSRLDEAGFKARAGAHANSIVVTQSAGPIPTVPGFNEGEFVVQDQAAQSLEPFLQLTGTEHCLDYCSAPGGKSVHLATILSDQGQVTATDIDPERLSKVSEAKARCRTNNLTVLPMSSLESEAEFEQRFDLILLDVPCSNTGVIRRRPELRHRLDQLNFAELIERQRQILEQSKKYLKPGGKICFSTCSIDQRENQQLVAAWLEVNQDFISVREQVLIPDNDHDGGYMALLQHKIAE